ncbi:MAG: hypothetical protein AAF517_00200 [Planctomycetota bacterium]
MFAAISLGLILCATVFTAALFGGRGLWNMVFRRLFRRTHDRLAARANLPSREDSERNALLFFRIGCLVSLLALIAMSIADGKIFEDDPSVLVGLAKYAVFSIAVGTTAVLIGVFCAVVIPSYKAQVALSRVGVRQLWFATDEVVPVDYLRSKEDGEDSPVAVVDVSGWDIFGKEESSIRDLIESIDAPVRLLLLDPEADDRDPERPKVSVRQSVLAELGIQAGTYKTRVLSSLEVVAELNAKRDSKHRIEVRFYREKPSFRAVFGQGEMLISPWDGRRASLDQPWLRLSRESEGKSLYDAHKRLVARLWATSVPPTSASVQRLSTAVRRWKSRREKKPAAENAA